MWFKHRAWIAVAGFLSLANVVAVWFAAEPAEPWHATVHAVLAVLFALGAQRLAQRGRSNAEADVVGRLQGLEARLAEPDLHQVAQALDAIAVEVERIGEGQRFLAKLLAERDPRSAVEVGASRLPGAIGSPEAPRAKDLG